MKYIIAALVTVLMINFTSGQSVDIKTENITINSFIEGTLLLPRVEEKPVLAIIIGDSGPTDRDGNQNFMQNNALKKLAEALSAEGLATFRYDKRIVKQIRRGQVDPGIMFDDFVDDAISVFKYFRKTDDFAKIVFVGHGQGSLVGLLAADSGVDGIISIAGSGKTIDEVIIDQVEKTAPMFTDETKAAFEIIRNGQTTADYPEALESIFSLDLQPFMANWMSYEPAKAMAEVKVPVLIICGTKDLQVSEDEAKNLKDANKRAELVLIENMNHVFAIIKGDDLENSKSYNESFRPVPEKLKQAIMTFISGL